MRPRGSNQFRLWKSTVWSLFLLTALWGLGACTPNSSSNSSTQTGTGSGGTGSYETNWKISLVPAQKSLYQSVASTTTDTPATLSTTSVAITVTDPSGKPAPNGATVYLTCANGAFGFRMISRGYDYAQPITTETRNLSNGKAWIDFIAGFSPGTGTINATYQGATGTVTVSILFTPTVTPTTSSSTGGLSLGPINFT